MALVVSVSQGTGAQDCTTLVVVDGTGTGATGYLAPNYIVADVVELVFDCIIPNSSVYTDPYVLTGATAQNIMNAVTNLTVNSQVLDQTLTSNSALTDGAYYARYTPYWLAATTINVTAGQTAVIPSASWAVAPYAGVNRVKIDGEYYGLTVTGALTGTLDRAYIGTTNAAQTWYAGFMDAVVLKQMCNGERCVSNRIAQLYNENCQCKQLAKDEAFQKKEDLYGAQELWDKGDYTQFQSLMNQVTSFCNDVNDGCNCT